MQIEVPNVVAERSTNVTANIDLADGGARSAAADMADGEASLPPVVFSARQQGTYDVFIAARADSITGQVRLRARSAHVMAQWHWTTAAAAVRRLRMPTSLQLTLLSS